MHVAHALSATFVQANKLQVALSKVCVGAAIEQTVEAGIDMRNEDEVHVRFLRIGIPAVQHYD